MSRVRHPSSPARRRLGRAALLLGIAWAPAAAQAPLPRAEPSRADSLLARGRLRAAEDALYAAVNASPRAPQARGELGRYLASRARFGIADVLFAEALRFGADTAGVAQAMVAIAAFRPEVDRRRIPGVRLPAPESAREGERLALRAGGAVERLGAPGPVVMRFHADGAGIGEFEVRGPGGARRAVLDPGVQGLLVARADDAALQPRSFGATGAAAPLLVPALDIGAHRIRGVEARVDPRLPEDEVRIGLDVLWPLRPAFDERDGTMTLQPEGTRAAPPGAIQVPIALDFPGMWLVPVVGEPPLRIESSRGRALRRASRWWWDAAQATLVIER